MRRTILTIALMLAWTPASLAADSKGNFAVDGVGVLPCKEYVHEFESRSANASLFIGWMTGYLTAYNQFSPETFDVTSWEEQVILGRYLSENCKRYPDVAFARAVISMVDALRPDRIAASEEKLQVTSGDAKLFIYVTTLKRVQQKLADLQLYKGEVDGTFGDKTRFAITEFQQGQGITVTGLPDQLTLLHLLRGKNS